MSSSSESRPTVLTHAVNPMSIPCPPGYYYDKPEGKEATRLYAVEIPQELLAQYAEVFWTIYWPNEPRPIKKRHIAAIRRSIYTFAAENVYVAYPGLPRHRDMIHLLTRGNEFGWLFVFKDDSTEALLNAPLDPADVAGAMEYLLIKDREPKWYD